MPYNRYMLTDPVAILQEIIDQDGDCESWATPTVCKRCPLGGKRIDGRRLNCQDYINRQRSLAGKTVEEVREAYVSAAEEELFAIELESHLE